MEWGFLLVVLLILALEVLWIIQFAQLMTLNDEVFPGRHDKVLWAVAFLALNVLGVFAFLWWKTIMVAVRRVEREQSQPPP